MTLFLPAMAGAGGLTVIRGTNVTFYPEPSEVRVEVPQNHQIAVGRRGTLPILIVKPRPGVNYKIIEVRPDNGLDSKVIGVGPRDGTDTPDMHGSPKEQNGRTNQGSQRVPASRLPANPL